MGCDPRNYVDYWSEDQQTLATYGCTAAGQSPRERLGRGLSCTLALSVTHSAAAAAVWGLWHYTCYAFAFCTSQTNKSSATVWICRQVQLSEVQQQIVSKLQYCHAKGSVNVVLVRVWLKLPIHQNCSDFWFQYTTGTKARWYLPMLLQLLPTVPCQALLHRYCTYPCFTRGIQSQPRPQKMHHRNPRGRTKIRKSGVTKFSWCLRIKCSKTHLHASFIPKFSRGYRPGPSVRRGGTEKGGRKRDKKSRRLHHGCCGE